MPRFSGKVKEIHDELWYNVDVVKAKSLLKELKDPLDIAFGNVFIIMHYSNFQQLGKFLELLTEIENENKRLKDQFLQIMINFFYCMYYTGRNSPIVSKELAEKFVNKIEQSYQDIDYRDDWEKYYCFGWYYYWIKAFYEWKIIDNISNAIKFQKMCVVAWSKVPEDGEYFSALGHYHLGLYYHMNGNFEDAEKSQNRVLVACKKYNNLYQLRPLGKLTNLSFIKGDLQKAKELNLQRFNAANQFNSTLDIFDSLTQKGFHLFQQGNHDEAIKAYKESLVYRKQHGEPLPIFWGYFQIFDFFYQRFKISKDKAILIRAEQTLSDLQELSEIHSDDKTVVNYTNYAHSLILKHGNIRKKGKAIDILEELLEDDPNNIGFSLNLLDLLFEDVIISEDQDTINQIEELMVKISKIPLRNNPQALFSYISQQIFLAKYNYYIKGDPSLALDILNDAKDRITIYKLDNLVHEIDAEIQVLERELTKWENVDISVKERIKASEFNKYIQQAVQLKNKQTEIG